MRNLELEAELIALARVRAERVRFPGIVIHFVPPAVDGKPAPIEPKCMCRAAPGKIVICRCRCGKCGDDGSTGPTEPEPLGAAYRRGANATEAA